MVMNNEVQVWSGAVHRTMHDETLFKERTGPVTRVDYLAVDVYLEQRRCRHLVEFQTEGVDQEVWAVWKGKDNNAVATASAQQTQRLQLNMQQ